MKIHFLITCFIVPLLAQSNCLGQKRVIRNVNNRYLAMEILKDDVIHFEVTENSVLVDQPIYTTQMVDNENYTKNYQCGPTVYEVNGDVYKTASLQITINANSLDVTVFDLLLQTVLSTFSYTDLKQPLNVLQWSRERTEAVYGVVSAFAADGDFGSPNGNFVGRQVVQQRPQAGLNGGPNATPMGNSMQQFEDGASSFTHFPVMYALGRNNFQWAFFLDNVYRHDWDLRNPTTWNVNMWGTIRFFVFQGSSLKDLRKKYMTLVGAPQIPSKEYFGLQNSIFGYENFDEVYFNIQKTREANIPVDGMVFDLQWYGGFRWQRTSRDPRDSRFGILSWDQTAFKDPVANVKRLRDEFGVGITVIEQPYIGKNNPTHELMRRNNALVTDCLNCPPTEINYNPWWGIGGMIDWSSPESNVWMDCKRCSLLVGCKVDPVRCAGEPVNPQVDITGFWMDLGEPELFNPSNRYWGYEEGPGNWRNSQGDVHNIYQLLSSQKLYEGYQRMNINRRVSSLVRTGAPGIHRYGVALWSGDVSCNLAVLGNHHGAQKHIIMAGIDSDVGGFVRGPCFRGDRGEGESYTRWLMSSSWMDLPVRPHANKQNPSTTTNPGLLGDVPSNRFNIVQRYELIPYYYSLAHRANRELEPVFEPMFLAFQNDQRTWSMGSQFMLGGQILIALDFRYNVKSTGVYLPKGIWYDYHTLERIESQGGLDLNRPLTQNVDGLTVQTTPAFVKEGTIVPKVFVDAQTMNVYGNRKQGPKIDTFITRVWPSNTATQFENIDDDGITREYLQGARQFTVIEQVINGNQVTVTIRASRGSFQGASTSRQYAVELVLPPSLGNVSSVKINGNDLVQNDVSATTRTSGYKATQTGKLLTAFSDPLPSNVDKVFVFEF
jgi:alpha-glucosidase (family GH31 glycosyl hydrolase)